MNGQNGSVWPVISRSAGRTSTVAVTKAETGLPGRPKTSVLPRVPNISGLPGRISDLPEIELDAEVAQHVLHVVALADAGAAGGDQHVDAVVEGAEHGVLELALVVADDAEVDDLVGVGREQRDQAVGVGGDDLVGAERRCRAAPVRRRSRGWRACGRRATVELGVVGARRRG